MNFFTDNQDLAFIFRTRGTVVTLYEDGFTSIGRFDYAPADCADALDSYRRVLAGDLAVGEA